MKIKPLNGRIIGKWVEEEAKNIIILNNPKKEKLLVLAVANDVTDVYIGDVALVSKYSTNQIDHDDESYLILKASEVLAIFHGD